MSKLLEYIKLIPKGLPNIDKVIEGLTNQVKMELGVIPQEDLEVIVGRRLICKECPYLNTNATKLGLYNGHNEYEHCTHCGCPIVTRTASLESNCGIEEYNNKHDKPLELKWKKVK